MKLSAAAVLAAAASVLAGHSNVTYTTEIVSSFVTYCPEATVLSYNEKTYTITEVRPVQGDSVGLRILHVSSAPG